MINYIEVKYVHRVESGIVDELTRRGIEFPKNTFTLLLCDSLAPKDVFCEQFLWSKLSEGKKCIYAVVDDPVPQIVRDKMSLKGWKVENYEAEGRLILIDVFQGEKSQERYATTTIQDKNASKNAPQEMDKIVMEIVKEVDGVDEIILDSLTIPFLLSSDPYYIIKFLFDWIERCRNDNFNILASLLDNVVPPQIQNLLISLSDNVIYLDRESKEPNFVVKKWYGGKKSSISLKYRTSPEGIIKW